MRIFVVLVLYSLLLGVNSNWPIIAVMAARDSYDIPSSSSLPTLIDRTGTSSSITTSNSASIADSTRQSTFKLLNLNVGQPLSAIVKVCVSGLVMCGGLALSYTLVIRSAEVCFRAIYGVKLYLQRRKMEKKSKRGGKDIDIDLTDDPLAGYDYSQFDPSYNVDDDLYPLDNTLSEEDNLAQRSAKTISSSSSRVSENETEEIPKINRAYVAHPSTDKLAKDQEELWRVVHNVFSGHTEKINSLVSSRENDRLLIAEKLEMAVSKVERIALKLSKRIEELEAQGEARNVDHDINSDENFANLMEEVRETKRDLAKVVQVVDNTKLDSDRLLKAHEERLIQKLRVTVDEVKELIKTSNRSKKEQTRKKGLK